MAVIIDMILAVAVVAAATGAVAEFQFRVGNVRSAADGALVGEILFLGCRAIRSCLGLEGDDFGTLGFAGTMQFCPPGQG